MDARRRHRAALQAASLAIVLAFVTALAIAGARRPADRDALAAEVAILRSQAAEVVLVHATAGTLPERVRKAHAAQLAHVVDDEAATVRQLDVQPALRAAAQATRESATRLVGLVGRLGEHAGAGGDFDDARAVVATLATVEQVLRR